MIAFQNEKINLLKAESISDLISAETEIQRQQAVKIMSGRSSEKFDSLRAKLLKILSNVEAKIDFPEEDLPDDIIKILGSIFLIYLAYIIAFSGSSQSNRLENPIGFFKTFFFKS